MLHLDYDFNMPPYEDGLYRLLPHPFVLDHQDPGDLVVFGGEGYRAEGIVVGREHGFGDIWLIVVERRSQIEYQ